MAQVIPFEEALEMFEDKLTLTPQELQGIEESINARVFTSKRITEAEILDDFNNAILKALKNGDSFGAFQLGLADQFEVLGWTGANPYRQAVIFRTQLQSVFNGGHYLRQREVSREVPFWQYLAVMDDRTRDAHAKMHGRVLLANDPWWNRNYPPNGYNCRCTVRALTPRQAAREGAKVEPKQPDDVFDAGFGFNVGQEAFKTDLSKYPKWLQSALVGSRNQ